MPVPDQRLNLDAIAPCAMNILSMRRTGPIKAGACSNIPFRLLCKAGHFDVRPAPKSDQEPARLKRMTVMTGIANGGQHLFADQDVHEGSASAAGRTVAGPLRALGVALDCCVPVHPDGAQQRMRMAAGPIVCMGRCEACRGYGRGGSIKG